MVVCAFRASPPSSSSEMLSTHRRMTEGQASQTPAKKPRCGGGDRTVREAPEEDASRIAIAAMVDWRGGGVVVVTSRAVETAGEDGLAFGAGEAVDGEDLAQGSSGRSRLKTKERTQKTS